MFSRVLAISTVALSMSSILAVAIPNPSAAGLLPGLPGLPGLGGSTGTSTISIKSQPTQPISPSKCSTGPVQCCNSVQKATAPAASQLLGLLGVVVQGVNVLVGLTCSPISVIGVGGDSCNAQAVCCENNSFGSAISLGCVPVTL